MSNKEDEVIKILAENVISKGYQVLSFDLPEHGERKYDTNYLCKIQNCEKDFFDAVVSTDSYNYFGRDEYYLD